MVELEKGSVYVAAGYNGEGGGGVGGCPFSWWLG